MIVEEGCETIYHKIEIMEFMNFYIITIPFYLNKIKC